MTQQTSIASGQDDEFEGWLAGLAGRVGTGVGQISAGHRQGRLMRQLISQRVDLAVRASEDSDARALDAAWMLTKARLGADAAVASDASIPPISTANVVRQVARPRSTASNRPRFALAAAAVAAMALGLSLFFDEDLLETAGGGGVVQMRGDEAPADLVVPTGSTVQQVASEIAAALEKSHIPYRQVQLKNAIQIQFKVPPGLRSSVDLERWKIKVPEHGRVDVLIRRTPLTSKD